MRLFFKQIVKHIKPYSYKFLSNYYNSMIPQLPPQLPLPLPLIINNCNNNITDNHDDNKLYIKHETDDNKSYNNYYDIKYIINIKNTYKYKIAHDPECDGLCSLCSY